MWWSDMWGGGYAAMPWMFFGPLMMVVFFVACIAVLYLSARGVRRPAGESAIRILKERFARGEIDQSEFEQRRRVLLG